MKVALFSIIFLLSANLYAGIGRIVSFKGAGEIHRNNTVLSAKLGMEIENFDTIYTKAKSKLQILFNDETVITLGKNSHFEVSSYLFDNKKSSKTKFKFFKGKFNAITGAIGKINPKGFKLETKSASIGIRGTQIELNLSDRQEFIGCIEGAISVTLLSSGFIRNLDAGESVSITINQKKSASNNNNTTSSSTTQTNSVDKKYDAWVEENSSIRKAVEDAFDKGHKQSYTTTYIKGSIDEKTDGIENFDSSDSTNTNIATFDMNIDFGKARDNNPVEVSTFKIKTSTVSSTVSDVKGNINDNNEIELTYKINSTSTRQDATGKLDFKNSDLDVEGKNLEFKTVAEEERVTIEEIQLEAQ